MVHGVARVRRVPVQVLGSRLISVPVIRRLPLVRGSVRDVCGGYDVGLVRNVAD